MCVWCVCVARVCVWRVVVFGVCVCVCVCVVVVCGVCVLLVCVVFVCVWRVCVRVCVVSVVCVVSGCVLSYLVVLFVWGRCCVRGGAHIWLLNILLTMTEFSDPSGCWFLSVTGVVHERSRDSSTSDPDLGRSSWNTTGGVMFQFPEPLYSLPTEVPKTQAQLYKTAHCKKNQIK